MTTTRNPWPLGIVAAVALFVAGTAGLIVLAAAHKSDLVSADYYEQEIGYQNRMDSLDRAHQLGAAAAVSYDAARRQITVSLPVDHVRHTVTGQVQLYRPSAAGLDRQFKLEPDPNGVQAIDAADLSRGLWKVRVLWQVGAEDFFLEQSITVDESAK